MKQTHKKPAHRARTSAAATGPAGKSKAPTGAMSVMDALRIAVAHHQAGRLDDAQAIYEQILLVEPAHADSLHLLGLIASHRGQRSAGIDLIMRAITSEANPVYYDNLGRILHEDGKLDAAAECFSVAISIAPGYAGAHNSLGKVLKDQRKLEAAAARFRHAIALQQDYVEAVGNLGNTLDDARDFDAAIEALRQAVALAPHLAGLHNDLGNALAHADRGDDAIASYRKAIELSPEIVEMYVNLGNALRDQGRFDEAAAAFAEAVSRRPDFAEARSCLVFNQTLVSHATPAGYLALATRYAEEVGARARPFETWLTDTQSLDARPLRVGFVSGDLNQHPVGFFLESILAHLDSRRVHAIAYPTRTYEDDLTARIKPHFSAWTCIAQLSDEAAARKIRDDRIDILVDLSGHTTRNRLAVFAWKPAPVQMTWLGYFASTGLAAMDYVLGDRHVLPEDEGAHFVEKPWRLPGDGYMCFTPPREAPDVAPLPALTDGLVTFGSFSNLVKMNDDVVALWSRVLHAVPESRLLLKSKQLNDAATRERTLARFAACGVDGARVKFEGGSSHREYLAAYNRVDIALNPFPYPGGTTSAEGFWMGVPVLCLRGDRFLGHLGESVVHSAALGDWIARDKDDYVAKAAAFAADLPRLAALRSGLRARVAASPLCDAPRFARHLEDAFSGMWTAFLSRPDTAANSRVAAE